MFNHYILNHYILNHYKLNHYILKSPYHLITFIYIYINILEKNILRYQAKLKSPIDPSSPHDRARERKRWGGCGRRSVRGGGRCAWQAGWRRRCCPAATSAPAGPAPAASPPAPSAASSSVAVSAPTSDPPVLRARRRSPTAQPPCNDFLSQCIIALQGREGKKTACDKRMALMPDEILGERR
jgi:hypothetical protein